MKEIDSDSKFLASLNINDYSLLLGIHFIQKRTTSILLIIPRL